MLEEDSNQNELWSSFPSQLEQFGHFWSGWTLGYFSIMRRVFWIWNRKTKLFSPFLLAPSMIQEVTTDLKLSLFLVEDLFMTSTDEDIWLLSSLSELCPVFKKGSIFWAGTQLGLFIHDRLISIHVPLRLRSFCLAPLMIKGLSIFGTQHHKGSSKKTHIGSFG